jgi:hypothetical protein
MINYCLKWVETKEAASEVSLCITITEIVTLVQKWVNT